MAVTPYTEIYYVFQSQFSDVEFNGLTALDQFQKLYLINSIPKFRRCLQNLNDRDDTNSTFNITLIDDEKQILGHLMVIEYLSPQIVTLKLIKQSLPSKDFNVNSQANHLKELLSLQAERKKTVSKMIVDYTYNFNDLKKLK